MPNKKIYLIISGAVMVIIAGVALFFALSGEKKEFQLVPRERAVADLGAASGAEVGTGWSYKENAADAVKEAAGMALRGKTQQHPDFAVIFASSGSDLPGILSRSQETPGGKNQNLWRHLRFPGGDDQ